MNYAIAEVGGSQVWLQENTFFYTNKLNKPLGTKISFTRIFLVNKNNNFELGFPFLKRIKVIGTILCHFKGSKVNVFKMKSKKKFRRRKGHRQELTKILINTIEFNNGT